MTLGVGALVTTSCNDFLDREPLSDITPDLYFNTENDLAAYCNNYYTTFFNNYGMYNAGPALDDMHTDNTVYGTGNLNYYAESNTHWLVPATKNLQDYFKNVRICNFFLQNVLPKYEAGTLSGDNVKHYIGEVYFMRALANFKNLTTFGDFPIVEDVLIDDDATLQEASKRAPRNEVARFILADLDKAIALLKDGKEFKKNRINKDLALLYKSRVALFEGTFEKYHKGTGRVPGDANWPGANMEYNAGKTFNIDGEISFFLDEAMKAAKQVADAHQLAENNHVMDPDPSKYETEGWNPYYDMFAMKNPSDQDEVLLWRQYLLSQSVANGWSPYLQQGGNFGTTKSFIDAFVMQNGLPIYAAGSGYKGDVSIDDQKADRDERLQLFVMGESNILYTVNDARNGSKFEPLLLALEEHRDLTGFRPRKHMTYDQDQIDAGVRGQTGWVVARAAEAYMNYVEACYVKNGNIDATADKYWKAIRTRAGINPDYNVTIGATDLAQEPDWAVYSNGQMVDKTLYNIRRDRRCEFISEDMRWNDLRRWCAFDILLTKPYIPEGINLWDKAYQDEWYYDTDKDGNNIFLLIEQEDGKTTANISNRNDSKYVRPYRKIKENNELWNGYHWHKAYYLSPISYEDMDLAPNLYQNPYWPTEGGKGALE